MSSQSAACSPWLPLILCLRVDPLAASTRITGRRLVRPQGGIERRAFEALAAVGTAIEIGDPASRARASDRGRPPSIFFGVRCGGRRKRSGGCQLNHDSAA